MNGDVCGLSFHHFRRFSVQASDIEKATVQGKLGVQNVKSYDRDWNIPNFVASRDEGGMAFRFLSL